MKLMDRLITPLLAVMPVAAFAWAYGGIDAKVFAFVMPVATLASLSATFLLPQRHGDESWRHACRRVFGAVMRDPFFWTGLALVLYLVFPLFNVGLCPGCDWRAIDAGANPLPPLRYLPFCVRPGEHAGVLRWFVGALAAALAVRHALTRDGKRHFLELLVWNGAAVALFGFAQLLTGAEYPFWGKVERPLKFFATFAYPNMAGAFFTVHYALALGLWYHRMGQMEERTLEDERVHAIRHPFVRAHYPAVAVAACFFAVLASLCRAAMMLTILLTAVSFVYMIGRLQAVSGMERARRLKSLIVAAALTLAAFGAISVYAPPDVLKELKTLNLSAVAERVSGNGQAHSKAVSAVMRRYPLFGVGGWGYRHFSTVYLDEREARSLRGAGGANVHNDYLQFAAEHGIVGLALIAACVWLLIAPVAGAWRKLVRASIAAARSNMGVSSLAVFSVAPTVLWSLLGCTALLVHGFGDCPFRSPAVLALFLTVMPAAAGYLPRPEKEEP